MGLKEGKDLNFGFGGTKGFQLDLVVEKKEYSQIMLNTNVNKTQALQGYASPLF